MSVRAHPILLSLVACVLTACSSVEPVVPTAPAAKTATVLADQEDDDDEDAPLLKCTPLAADSAAAWIGPAGGQLIVGPHRFTVPAGALDSTVHITARIIPDSVVSLKFGPSGLTFKQKARVELSTAHCTAFPSSSLLVAHVDDAATTVIETVSTNAQVDGVWAELEHFTRWAIAY